MPSLGSTTSHAMSGHFKVEDSNGLFHRFSLDGPVTFRAILASACRWGPHTMTRTLLTKDPEDGEWNVLTEEALPWVMSRPREGPILLKISPAMIITPPWPDMYSDTFQLIRTHVVNATARLANPCYFRNKAERNTYNARLRSKLISDLGIESFVRDAEGGAATVVVREALYRTDVLAETAGGPTATLERVDYQLEDGWPFSIPCYVWRPNESPDGSRSTVRRPALIYMGDGPKYFWNSYKGRQDYTEAMMLQAVPRILLGRIGSCYAYNGHNLKEAGS